MDQSPLVEMQLKDGQKLVDALVTRGLEVKAALWAKMSDDDKWYLYIISPLVDTDGSTRVYGRIHPVIRELQKQPFWVDPFEVKVLGARSPVAEAVAKLRGDYPGITRSGGTELGGVTVEGAYIYPALASPKT